MLEGTGFRLVKSIEGFTRRTPTGSHTLTVPIWDYRPTFTFSLVVGIRLDAVEDLFNESSGLPPASQKRSKTVLTLLEHFTGPGRGEYTVTEPTDVDAAMREIGPVLELDVLPFLERYSDVGAIDEALHGQRVPGFDITQTLFKARHALVVARLAGNPRYPDLVQEYRAMVADAPPVELERFEQLVARLDSL